MQIPSKGPRGLKTKRLTDMELDPRKTNPLPGENRTYTCIEKKTPQFGLREVYLLP